VVGNYTSIIILLDSNRHFPNFIYFGFNSGCFSRSINSKMIPYPPHPSNPFYLNKSTLPIFLIFFLSGVVCFFFLFPTILPIIPQKFLVIPLICGDFSDFEDSKPVILDATSKASVNRHN